MRFPTELRIFFERPKPKTFEEYIIDQIINGRDINFRKKEAFVMLERLQNKRAQLVANIGRIGNHEDEILSKVAEFENNLRKQYEDSDRVEKDKLTNQLEIVDELINEELNQANEASADQIAEEENSEQVATENYDPTNEINVEGE